VDNARYPTEDAEGDVDEEICGTAPTHCDRNEWHPYCEEVEKDGTLRVIRSGPQCDYAGDYTVLDVDILVLLWVLCKDVDGKPAVGLNAQLQRYTTWILVVAKSRLYSGFCIASRIDFTLSWVTLPIHTNSLERLLSGVLDSQTCTERRKIRTRRGFTNRHVHVAHARKWTWRSGDDAR
jgi:hypothetical protein